MTADAHDSIWDPVKGQELAIQLLELLDSRRGVRYTIENAITLVQEHTEFEAVGVRLREGDDYPHYVTSGLSAGLCEAKRSLCVSPGGGDTARNVPGVPILECFCGAVVSGQVDPSQPWFTTAGSFWSNNAARTASSMPADAIPPGFRGRCFQDGHESIALIPLRCDREIVGLLQLCDTRPDCLTLELIRYFERLGASIGVSIRRAQAEQSLHERTEALRESQRRYRELTEGLPQPVFETDTDGNIEVANQSAFQLFMIAPEDLANGLNVADTLVPGDRKRVADDMRSVLREQQAGAFEYTAQTRIGTTIPIVVHAIAILRDDKPAGVRGVIFDITKRKRVEAALKDAHDRLEEKVERRTAELREAYRRLALENEERKASETLYKTLVEASPNAVIQTDLSRQIIYASPRAAKLHGHDSAAEMLGMGAFELIAPECHQEAAACVEETVLKNKPVTAEFEFLRKNGARFVGRIVFATVQNEQGQITGLMGVCQNIDEQKRAEANLELMARVFEETREGIALADLDGTLVKMNNAFATMHGFCPGELLGRNLSDLHTSEQLPTVMAINEQILKTGYFDGEVWHVRRDGTPFLSLMHNTVMNDREGNPTYVIGTMVDISERKRLEDVTRIQRDIAVSLSSVETVKDGLQLCLETAIDVSGMDVGAIYLVDEVSGDVDLAIHCGLPPESLELVKHYSSTSSRAELVRRGSFVYWSCNSMGLFEDEAPASPKLKSAAIVPIHHQGRPVACLNLASLSLTDIPTTTRLRLESIAGQIAGAIARLSAEEAARHKQELISAVLDHSPALVCVKDLEGRYQLASQRMAEMAQRPIGEIIGRTDSQLFPEAIAKVFSENDRRVLEQGESLQIEELAVVDGEERCFLSTRFALHDPDGTPVSTVGISVDATDRKRVEEALRESQKRYRDFVTSGPQGMWCYKIAPPMPTDLPEEEQIDWTCKHAVLEECNDAYARLQGFSSAADAEGRRYVEVLGGSESMARDVIRVWIESGYSFDRVELPQMSFSGAPIWTLVSGVGFVEDKRVVRTWGTVIDITDRKLTEQQLNVSLQRLEESERRLKEAQHAGHVGAWHWDIEPDIVHWSEEVFRIFGVDQGSFEPSFAAILAATHPEDRSFFQQRARRVLDGDEAVGHDQRIVRPCGEVRHIRIQGEVLRDSSETPVTMAGAVLDITERKNAEEILQRAKRLSAIGTLAAGIAHEINNPIGSAMLAAETVVDINGQPGKEDVVDRCLHEIVRSLERCSEIVRSVLRFSRDGDSERRSVQINDVIRQAIDHVRLNARRHGVQTNAHLDDSIPELHGNQLELELAVVNVIQNALEAGEHPRPIEVSTQLSEKGIQISVQDWGPGMTADVREHFFDPFFTTRLKKGGTGLGASIAYGIVKAHGGRMHVESSLGEGTRISIILPLNSGVPQ